MGTSMPKHASGLQVPLLVLQHLPYRDNSWLSQEQDSSSQEKLSWVQKVYVIYNCCTDLKRFPQGLPLECHLS
ncbi:hypothetical protein AAC387_Pa04g0552 [Persea americana]